MADLERKVEKLDERVTSLEIQFSALMAKVDKTIDEIHDIRQEMRDRDNQRAEDIREIRQDIKDMGRHVRNLSLTAMGAIGTMVVTVIISLLRS